MTAARRVAAPWRCAVAASVVCLPSWAGRCPGRAELEDLAGHHCLGLALDGDASASEARCAEACCAEAACEVWQYHPAEGCFRGRAMTCRRGASGFAAQASGARLEPLDGADWGVVQTYGDPRNYNALALVEPYMDGPQEVRMATDNGDTLLIRRFGPGEEQLQLSVSCWSPSREPGRCCGGGGAPCWADERAHRRCCGEGAAMDVETGVHAAFDVFVDVTAALSRDQRHALHAALPRVEVVEAAFQANAARWGHGRHPAHSLCASGDVGTEVDDAVGLRALVRILQPHRVSRAFVNIGAGDCGPADPLHELLHSEDGREFRGLAVDVDGEKLGRCVSDAAASGHGVQIRPVRCVVDPLTIAAELAPHLGALLGERPPPPHGAPASGRSQGRWPIDLLVVDIDGCDCVVLRELLEVVQPKIIMLELAFHIPPPFRFSLQCGLGSTAEWLDKYKLDQFNAASGCSLSYAINMLAAHDIHLLRLAQQDAIFVHSSVAGVFEQHFSGGPGAQGLQLPQDEFACYRSSKLWMQLPAEYMREWFFASHPASVFGRVWSNLSLVSRMYGRDGSHFTLDY